MPGPKPTPEGAVLRFFRFSQKVSEEDLARRAGVAPRTVKRWEQGSLPLSRERLIEVLAHLDVPPEAADEALLAHRLAHPPQGSSSPTEPPEEERRLIGRVSAAAALRGAQAACMELTRESHRAQARRHRAWAEERWSRLARIPARKQERIVETLLGDDRSWALAERLCLASEAAAADRASEALRLARLAVRVAGQSPGGEPWRLLLLGWSEPFLGNAVRVGGELTAADAVFASAEEHWRQGAGGDPAGLLDGTRRLDLEASLRMHQGQLERAGLLLDQALKNTRDDKARGRLLIKKATALGIAGDYEASLSVLREAKPDERKEPRLLFLHRFTWAANLCHLDRYLEAEPLVALIESLVADLGNELDQVRSHWLKGKTWAGLGRRVEALAIFSQVRQYFRSKDIAYDFALVTLELAVLHLEQGRTHLVQTLAEEMLWIFEKQKVHTEALAALKLFCRAAKAEEAQAAWTRRLIKYLYRAQHNPGLRFEP